MDKLEPCPHCGGNAYLGKEYDPNTTGAFYYIQCKTCRAKSGHLYAVETCPIFFASVRDKWNTRTTPTVQEAAEVLKSAKSAFKSGCEQGSDEATAYEWGSVPQQTRESAWSDFMAEWNPDSAALRALAGEGQ